MMGGRQTHGWTSKRDSRPSSVALSVPLFLSLNVYIPGLYFSIVSCITASAGADFAVRRHRPIAPAAAIERKKGGQRYICLFICRQIQWNLVSRATTISAPAFFPPSLSLFPLSLFLAFSSEHIYLQADWLAMGRAYYIIYIISSQGKESGIDTAYSNRTRNSLATSLPCLLVSPKKIRSIFHIVACPAILVSRTYDVKHKERERRKKEKGMKDNVRVFRTNARWPEVRSGVFPRQLCVE